MPGVGQRCVGRIHVRAIDPGRDHHSLGRNRSPLRGQPAWLVGLVPDRPIADSRERFAVGSRGAVGAAVARPDGGDKLAEIGRARPVMVGVLRRRRSAHCPQRARGRDVEVDPDSPRGSQPCQPVVRGPSRRAVGRGIAGVETARLGCRGRIRGQCQPQHRDAQPIDAETAERVECPYDRRLRRVQHQLVVLEDRLQWTARRRLIARRRRGGRG